MCNSSVEGGGVSDVRQCRHYRPKRERHRRERVAKKLHIQRGGTCDVLRDLYDL